MPQELIPLVNETMDLQVPFDYNIIRVDQKGDDISYVYSPDFDVASEPRIEKSIKLYKWRYGKDDNYDPATAQIYHVNTSLSARVACGD